MCKERPEASITLLSPGPLLRESSIRNVSVGLVHPRVQCGDWIAWHWVETSTLRKSSRRPLPQTMGEMEGTVREGMGPLEHCLEKLTDVYSVDTSVPWPVICSHGGSLVLCWLHECLLHIVCALRKQVQTPPGVDVILFLVSTQSQSICLSVCLSCSLSQLPFSLSACLLTINFLPLTY